MLSYAYVKANAAVARARQHPTGAEPEIGEREDWDGFDN
jgi:hypothetical protein